MSATSSYTGEASATRPRIARRNLIWGVLALAIILRLVFFIGYQGHDDRSYIAYAYYYANHGEIGSAHLADPWVTRFAGWLPIAVSMKLLGLNQFAIVFYSFLCSLGSVILAFLLGELLFDTRTGLVGALLFAFLPLDILYATRAYADEAVAFYLMLAYYLFLRGARKGSGMLLWLSGAAIGVGYLHKETAVFFFLPVALYIILKRPPRRKLIMFPVLGFLLIFLVEYGFWAVAAGDPLFRIHTMAAVRHLYVPDAPPGWHLIPGPKPDEIFRSRNSLMDAVLMFLTHDEYGLLWFIVWPLIAYLSWTRDGPTQPLRIWVVPIAPCLLFLPLHFPHYTLNRDPRYFASLSIPALLALAYWLMKQTARTRWFVATVLVATWIPCVYLAWVSSQMSAEKQLVAFIRQHGDRRTWLSNRLAADVTVLSGFDTHLPIGVHKLSEDPPDTRRKLSSGMHAMRPETPIAVSAGEIDSGFVALARPFAHAASPAWVPFERIVPRADTLTQAAQRLLASVGVPAPYVEKLTPSHGDWVQIYRVP